ncbi:hypothetical protein L0Y40_01215 [Candidatus Wolfebacteria bacterium]|nr:hypothetical protein [Candidatus Wolfebacteria bacterium]
MTRKQSDDDSPLEELEGQLYARREMPASRRPRLHPDDAREVASDWQHEHPHVTPGLDSMVRRKKGKFVKPFLLFAVIFFVIAVGIAAVVITRGGNTVSSRNVEVSVTGPVQVDAGDILSFTVSVSNENTTALETTDLIVEFAPGTRDPDDTARELPRLRESLGRLNPGAVAKKEMHATAFGKSGDKQEIIVSVEYRIVGSNAVFVKEKAFTYEIGHTPVTLLVDAPSEINAGQEFEMEVSVVSNSTETLKNLLLVAEYPFGFVFGDAAPRPSQGSRVWDLGDLAPGAKKVVRLRATVEGQDEEERTVRFTVGVADANKIDVVTPFLTETHTLALRRPFVEVNITLNGSVADEVAVLSGEPVRVDLSWRNNLPDSVVDVVVVARLSGTVLNKSSVTVDDGFYRSNTNTVTWDRQSDSSLGELPPGATGQLSFTFEPLDLSDRADITSPEIDIVFSLTARRLGDASAPSTIATDLGEKIIRVNSDIALAQRAVHFVGPFTNSGPMPPEAEEDTTYTIIWSISNTSNNVDDVQVSATLPSYVEWMGATDPSGEKISFSPVGGQVIWDVGEVARGIGIGNSPREVAFRVSLTPSISQVGAAPTLVSEVRLSGTDEFTGAPVGASSGAVTTRLTTDPEFEEDQGRVVE